MAGLVIPESVKRAGEVQNITAEQAAEYLKCQQDPEYFIETYVKITDIDEGVVPFDMYDYQRDMVKLYHDNRFNINLLSRQSGKTAIVSAYALHHALFADRKNVKILANKYDTAKGILDRIKKMYELLPRWIQQGVLSWNAASLELENYSQISVGTTTPDSGRSASISLLILDEFAFVRNNIADDFWAAAYPVISSGEKTKVVIVSTANGLNLFYKMWTDAVNKRNEFVPYSVSWNQVPGRDEKWRKQTVANLGGDEDKFKQEYENEFLGNSNSLIPISKLKTLVHKTPLQRSDYFNIYELPSNDRTYFMAVDVSRGIGNDYSAFQVIDITDYPYRQVAVYRNNTVEATILPSVIYKWGTKYNDAFVLLEANDLGEGVGNTLHQELEYENVLLVSHQGRAGQRLGGGFSRTVRAGVMTSKRTKNIGVTNLKSMIMTDQLIINDFNTIQEFATFTQKKDSYEAEEGAHDDLVMGLVVFGWAVQEPYFKDLTDKDLRIKMEKEREEELMETVPVFGFIDDGKDEDGEWETVEHNDFDNWGTF